MKKIILHHVQKYWADTLLNHSGVHWEGYMEDVKFHLETVRYDFIRINLFEEWKRKPEHDYMLDGRYYGVSIGEYGYAWYVEGYPEDGGDLDLDDGEVVSDDYDNKYMFVSRNNGRSPWILIPEWLDEVRKGDLYIAGCFDHECMEDLELLLEYSDIEYTRIEELIY